MNALEKKDQPEVFGPFEFWFNVFLPLSAELNFIMGVVDVIKIIVNLFKTTVKEDKVLTQLKKNSEFMSYVYEQVNITNNKTNQLINSGLATGYKLDKIKDAQLIQAGMLSDISQELLDINSNLRNSYSIISEGVSNLGKQSLAISSGIENILTSLVNIQIQLKKIEFESKLNSLALQLSLPYQKLIYVRERYNILSDGVFNDDNQIEEIPDELMNFVYKVTDYGKDGLLYNMIFVLDELKGNNFTGIKSSATIIGSYIDKLNSMPAPLTISSLSWIVSQYASVLNVLSQSLSLAGMCYALINKEIPDSIINNIVHDTESEKESLASYLNVLLKSEKIINPGLTSSLYSDQWIKFELDSGIASKSGNFSLKADDGQAIVGFELFRDDDDHVITKIYQAKVLPYYCIEDSTEGAVTTKSVDLTGLLLGSDSWPHGIICNNDFDNHSFFMNKHRKFNDGFLITQIDFTGTEPSPVRFNYEVYASKYEVETGTLSTDKTVANDSNSSNVTALVRKIADVFYDKTEKTAGLPVTKLVDAQLSPLNGFYLFIQGGDIDVDPLVIMTDVTLNKQINYYNQLILNN